MPSPRRKRLIALFWSNVEKTDIIPEGFKEGHWFFNSEHLRSDGYGHLPVHANILAHRFSYEINVGPIPPLLEIDHLCRVRKCVQPEHLEPVSRKTNILRGMSPTAINARKTECSKGHPFDDDNTYVSAKGSRQCRTCLNIAIRKTRLKSSKKLKKMLTVNS